MIGDLRTHRSKPRCTWPVALVTALLGAAELAAEIKVKTLPNGQPLIYNETPRQRARRTASRLTAVPDAGLERSIRYFASRASLSPQLVQAVVQVESGYNPQATSVDGAMGLMQLMPETAADLGVSRPYDVDQNLRGGTTYLRQMLDRFGNLELALAAYNAGPKRIDQYGGVPPFRETRDYLRKVLTLYSGQAPPRDLQAEARYAAWRRQRQEARQRASEPGGRQVFITRDANNRIVVTTDPPR